MGIPAELIEKRDGINRDIATLNRQIERVRASIAQAELTDIPNAKQQVAFFGDKYAELAVQTHSKSEFDEFTKNRQNANDRLKQVVDGVAESRKQIAYLEGDIAARRRELASIDAEVIAA